MSKVVELEGCLAGMHIDGVCDGAVREANRLKCSVHFEFNGIDVVVTPGEVPKDVAARWSADMKKAHDAWVASPEYAERQKKWDKEAAKARAAHMTESAKTEAEMRDAKVPWPLTKEQLVEYIESLINRKHDYGTCVYAVSMAAMAAFNFASEQIGVTGFQASCADLDFIRRARSLEGPFILIKAEDALYPQYDLHEKLEEAMNGWAGWLKDEAIKNLSERHPTRLSPEVKKHWEKLSRVAIPAPRKQ